MHWMPTYAFFVLYFHLGKGLGTNLLSPGRSTWLSGSVILLVALGACFTGYVLVFGQMSFWALIVILNLVTVIPILDELVVMGLYGASYPVDWALGRMFVLHFLLGMMAAFSVLMHLICIHRARPSNSHVNALSNLSDVVLKDLGILALCMVVWCTHTLHSLVHPDNFGPLSRLQTPAHIEPEAYFLFIFSVLKARSLKIIGVIAIISNACYHFSIA